MICTFWAKIFTAHLWTQQSSQRSVLNMKACYREGRSPDARWNIGLSKVKRCFGFDLNRKRNWDQFPDFFSFFFFSFDFLWNWDSSTPPRFGCTPACTHATGIDNNKYAFIENLPIINKVDDSLLFQYDVNIRIKLAFYCYGSFVLLQSSVVLANGLNL